MTKRAKLLINCSEESLHIAAVIAPDYQLDVAEVAELAEELRAGDPALAGNETVFFERASKLRDIMVELVPLLAKLRDLELGKMSEDSPHVLRVPYLATMLEYQTLSHFRDVVNGLWGAAMSEAAWADLREEVVNPRKPLIVAMMSMAADHWFECHDEFPECEFVETEDGFMPKEGTGIEFIARMVLAVAESVDIEDIRANVTSMQNMIGMTGAMRGRALEAEAEAAEQAAKRAHLRVIK